MPEDEACCLGIQRTVPRAVARKQATLASQTRIQKMPLKKADPLSRLPVGIAVAPPPQEEPEEVLVADPRDRLTPSRLVDQKLLALLRTRNPGLDLQATNKPRDIRRLPREHQAMARVCRILMPPRNEFGAGSEAATE
jgi:hypothetical protein